jgi:hypothetical protein
VLFSRIVVVEEVGDRQADLRLSGRDRLDNSDGIEAGALGGQLSVRADGAWKT